MITQAEYHQRDRSIPAPALTPGYRTSIARSPRYALISLEQSPSEITGRCSARMISARSTMT